MGEHEAVVWVRRSDWERVTEREELVGRLRAGSRFPQYLKLVNRVQRHWVDGRDGEGRGLLDDCDVYWSCRTRSIDLSLAHIAKYQIT